MDYKAIGKKIISLVGGTENIRQLTHCATRLRFEFYKKEKVDVKSIENIPGVIGVVEKGGQFQVIIGNEVQTAFRAISEEMKHSEENDGNDDCQSDHKCDFYYIHTGDSGIDWRRYDKGSTFYSGFGKTGRSVRIHL